MTSPPNLLVIKNEQSKRWPQFLVACSATIVVFSTGFHTGWPSPALPKLLSEEYPHDVTNDEASYITIMGHVGDLLGGLVGAALLDKIGRRRTILFIALPQLISYGLIILSYQIMELLYVARIIGGVAEGMTFTIVPVYIAEIAEPSIRGSLGTLISVSSTFGTLYINLVGSYMPINITAITCVVFPLIFLLLFWKMPESPYFLLMKNRRKEEAEASLKFLRRKRSVGDELSVMIRDVNRQMSESGTFRDVISIDSNRKAFLLVVGLRIFQQFTGVSAFSLYIQILLAEATDSIPPHIGASILIIVQLLMAVLSTFFVDRYGRKPLLLLSMGGCCLNLFFQTIYFALKEYTDVDLSAIDWFPLAMLIMFMFLYFTGLGVVVTVLVSEIFSASIKSKAICLANTFLALAMLSTTKFYQVTADEFGLTVPFCSFTIVTFLAVIFLYFKVPETKGKSLEEIQQELKGHKIVRSSSGKM